MELENSLITTWKDTQVPGACLLSPHQGPRLVGKIGTISCTL